MAGILHGLWLNDAFFCYMLESGNILPPYEWRNWFEQAVTPLEGESGWKTKERIVPLCLPASFAASEKRSGLANIDVSGISMTPGDMSKWLIRARELYYIEKHEHSPFHFGEDIWFWCDAALFAVDLAAEGRIVPGIDIFEPTKWSDSFIASGPEFSGKGIWRPDLSQSVHKQKFRMLSQQMPPASAAYVHDDRKGWLQSTPRHILYSFLSAALDEWIRAKAGPQLLRELNRRIGRNDGYAEHSGLHWWRALLSPGVRSYLSLPISELRELDRNIRDWAGYQTPLPPKQRIVRNLKLAFQLEAEDKQTSEQPWRLRFFLYPQDDPSLLLPAEQIWEQKESRDTSWQERKFMDAPASLLFQLSAAAESVPLFADLLERTDTPSSIKLDTEEAYHFLKETAGLLMNEGYTVKLPSWWTDSGRKAVRTRVKVNIHPMNWDYSAGLGLQKLLQFDAAAALGDETMSIEELKAAAASKAPLIQYRGQWVEVDQQSLRKAVAFLENPAYRDGTMQMKDLLHLYAQPDLQQDDSVRMTHGTMEMDWELPDSVERFLQGDWKKEPFDLPVPQGLQTTLRPYQKRGFQWMAFMRNLGFGSCLADDMGLGKTVQIIALLLNHRETMEEQEKHADDHASTLSALILCPTSVLWNWQKELNKFAPSLKVLVHHGADRKHGKAFLHEADQFDVILSSYPLVMRDEHNFQQREWDYLILDEAQHIKNRETKQSKAVARLKWKAKSRIALTGTPMENRLSELWSVFDFLNPGYLGEFQKFQTAFAAPIEKFRDDKKTDQLKVLVQPFIMRRMKSDPEINKELPDKLETKSYCTLTAEQVSLYQAVMDQMLTDIEGEEGMRRKGRVMAGLNYLKQICNHPVLYLKDQSRLRGRSGKVKRLLEITDAVLESGEAALIFTQYARMGDLLVRLLSDQLGFEPLFLHGQVKPSKREELITSFQDRSGPPIFVLSLKAGGVGLNLTRANHVIHFDRWWNPAVEEQATDRAFRIGQYRNVHVHKMICHGTLEERIDEMLEAKKDLLNSIVGSGESWLTEMSNQELRELISLRDPMF